MRAKTELRAVQRRCIDELKDSVGCIFVAGMGAGKTVTVATAIRELLDEKVIRAAIVVAPRRVALDTWPKEFAAWQHIADTRLSVVAGSAHRRRKMLLADAEVYVVGIDNLVWLLDTLDGLPEGDPRFDLLAIDELSKLAGPRGVRAKALKKFAPRFGAIWGATGTPRPNSDEDLYMPLQIVSASTCFDQSFDEWRRARFRPMDQFGYRWSVHDFARKELAATMNEWSFTIPPEEVVDTPFNSGEDFDLFFDLTQQQVDDLDSLNKHLLMELGLSQTELTRALTEGEDDVLFAMSKAVAVGKMSQVLQGFVYRDGEVVQVYKPHGRLEVLAEAHESAGGEPMLIPYWYQEDVPQMQGVIDDLVVLADQDDVARTIDAWNAGDIPRLALHPASAGHGLNLQFGGARLCWYANVWSGEAYIQTVKRLARPGQKLPVFSHRLRARHWLEDMRINRAEGKVAREAEFIAGVRTI